MNNISSSKRQTPEGNVECSLLSLSNATCCGDPIQKMSSSNSSRPTTPLDSPIHSFSGDSSDLSGPYNQQINKGKKTKKRFPMVLMDLLDNPSNSDYATFKPNGKSFSILRPYAFTSDLLPRYFGMTKFSSFVRKLYRWGFLQSTYRDRKTGRVSYYHPKFRRGEMALCRDIKCLKSNNRKSSSKSLAAGSNQKADFSREKEQSVVQVCPQQERAGAIRSLSTSPVAQQSSEDETKPEVVTSFGTISNRDTVDYDVIGHNPLPPQITTIDPLLLLTTMDLDQITLLLLRSSKIGYGPNKMRSAFSTMTSLLYGHALLCGDALIAPTNEGYQYSCS